jgi:zinc protease
MKRPLFLLLLAVVITAQLSCTRTKPPAESPPTASSTPTEEAKIDQILERYEQAIGGKDAIAAITSYKLKGTFQLPGVSGTIEGWRKEPRKTLTIIQFPKIGPVKKGFDGENHWIQTASGIARDSNSQEIAELERDSEVYSAGKIKELFATMKLDNKARLNGRDMHVVEGKPAKGPAEKLFFDVDNGLLLRWDMARRHPKQGIVFVKVHLDDYKEISGVKIPFKVRFAFESFNFTVKVEEMQHNIPLDDAIFRRPQDGH